MITCRKCKQEKELSAFYNAKLGRFGKRAACKVCCEKYRKQYCVNNKDKIRSAFRLWQKENYAERKKYNMAWRKANPIKVQQHNKTYIKIHKAKVLAYWAKRKKQHPEIFNAYKAKRRATILCACPIWSNLEAIKEKYKEAQRISKETGIKHHVDHIIPLNSKFVSGLHVENNLRVITAEENIKKANRFIEGI